MQPTCKKCHEPLTGEETNCPACGKPTPEGWRVLSESIQALGHLAGCLFVLLLLAALFGGCLLVLV